MTKSGIGRRQIGSRHHHLAAGLARRAFRIRPEYPTPAIRRTSTCALTNVALGYGLQIAGKGWERAIADDPGLADGLNIARGAVADAFDLPCENL